MTYAGVDGLGAGGITGGDSSWVGFSTGSAVGGLSPPLDSCGTGSKGGLGELERICKVVKLV